MKAKAWVIILLSIAAIAAVIHAIDWETLNRFVNACLREP